MHYEKPKHAHNIHVVGMRGEKVQNIAPEIFLLDHYSVPFTFDTYMHVLDSHKIEGMALMEELLDMTLAATACAYPIIVTPLQEGDTGSKRRTSLRWRLRGVICSWGLRC